MWTFFKHSLCSGYNNVPACRHQLVCTEKAHIWYLGGAPCVRGGWVQISCEKTSPRQSSLNAGFIRPANIIHQNFKKLQQGHRMQDMAWSTSSSSVKCTFSNADMCEVKPALATDLTIASAFEKWKNSTISGRLCHIHNYSEYYIMWNYNAQAWIGVNQCDKSPLSLNFPEIPWETSNSAAYPEFHKF